MTKQEGACHRSFHAFIPEAAWEHARKAHEEMRQGAAAWLPPAFLEHRRAARKEMLLALRSLIDGALERFDQPAAED